MSHYISFFIALLVYLASSSSTLSDDDATSEKASDTTIRDLMVTKVTPATDKLWGAEDPQTDAEWQELNDAADLVIEAFTQAKAGGGGPNDANWAGEENWQRHAEDVIAAAQLAKTAIAARNIDALWEAGDPLYTPCESCHQEYHPGVREE
jgi:cytochrome c556